MRVWRRLHPEKRVRNLRPEVGVASRGHLWRAVAITGAVLVAIQLIPYGRDHHNPPVRAEPEWSSPEVRELAVRACFDCHSNETRWPWYASVAPMSWIVTSRVERGRRALNFSELDRRQGRAHEAPGVIRSGQMPMHSYRWLSPAARLDADERETLARGLYATFGPWSNEPR